MSSVCFCPHCQRPIFPLSYTDQIMLYLDQFKPFPEDVHEVRDPYRFTAKGLSERMEVPIAAVYRVKDNLVACGLIDPCLRPWLTPSGKRMFLFSATERGHRYVSVLRTFQEAVREL